MRIVESLRKGSQSATPGFIGGLDPILAAIAIALIGFGVIMVFTASAVEATVSFSDPQYYLKRQVIFGIASVILMFVVARIDYHRLRTITYPILALVTLLLLACVAGFGQRWRSHPLAAVRAHSRSTVRDGQASVGALVGIFTCQET